MLSKFLSNCCMRIIALFAVLILTGISSYGQNLVGYKYEEIRKYMKQNRTDMNYNKVSNSKFKYLKYTNGSDSQTLLFFLNPDSVCSSVRMICDMGLKAEKENEFNSIYEKTGENKWIDRRCGNDYLIELKDEKWSCEITIEPVK
jgi:hypothetical protein